MRYFEQGRLIHVEGHIGDPVRSLGDLGTWRQGNIRQDSAVFAGKTVVFDPRLDAALDAALQALTARGVVEAPGSGALLFEAPAPPVAPVPPVPPVPPLPQAGSWPRRSSQPQSAGTGGLPPLSRTVAAHADTPNTPTGLAQQARLTPPQWQLVALVVRQMVEKVDQLAGAAMAESLLRQSLAHAARSNPLLHDLEVESDGWLKETWETAMTSHAAEDVAEAMAALLTNFELRSASLIGKDRAHHVLASTAEPYRAALAQMGLDVAG